MERICVRCGQEMMPVKNSFWFLLDRKTRSSDLWGCRTCNNFQIHGAPNTFINTATITSGVLVPDPGNNENFQAIINPKIIAPYSFGEHMAEWYPGWPWKEGGQFYE